MSELSSVVVPSDLKQLASDVVAKARKAGASDAEAVVYEGEEFGALVRLGQVEQLKESGVACGRAAGVLWAADGKYLVFGFFGGVD